MIDFPKKNLERFTFIFIFINVFVGIYLSRTNLSFYEGAFVREDSYIEWLTFCALFFGMAMSLYRIYILKPFRNTAFIFGLYTLACIFLFGLGEEVSWGQRIFGYDSPAFFLKYNTQGEFNLHNLRFGDFKVNRYIFGTFLGIMIACYFLILPLIYKKFCFVKSFVNKFAIPVPRGYQIVAYLILFGLVQLIAGGKKGEILEFGGCWITILMLFQPQNREMFSRRSIDR